jgi:ABC-2 type transport system ATP-binding protein
MARVHGLRGAAAARGADEWLERLGAAGYAGQPLRNLSKGMCQKVAIAQALLSRPGLLVLDEAWTGLDQAARGALDAAVLERVAGGGSVMFVDHDQARLAGRIGERWRLDGDGRVSVVPGDASDRAADDFVVIVELAGVEGDSLARIEDLPGVLSCSAAAVRPGTGAGLATVRVTAGRSDDVLRQVLSWDGVHVVAVRPEAASREEAAGR